jgi:hypothetical protein
MTSEMEQAVIVYRGVDYDDIGQLHGNLLIHFDFNLVRTVPMFYIGSHGFHKELSVDTKLSNAETGHAPVFSVS